MDELLAQTLRDRGGITMEEEPIVEETAEEIAADPIVEDSPIIEEEAIAEPPALEKKKIEYNKFLEDNDDVFSNYYKEKNTNYSDMAADKLAEMQIRKASPHLSDADIKEELADKYGVGLARNSENEDDYEDAEDFKQAKLDNKALDKLQRQLKKDAPLMAKEFEDGKQSIILPDFEMDFEAPKANIAKTDEEYIQELQEKGDTYKKDVWIPELKKALESFENIKQQVEYEDNGSKVVLDVDYKLSDGDKEELINELQDYIVTGKDRERYQDLDGFLKDKAPAKYYQKLMTTVAKEAAAKARANFVKNDLLNYDDSTRNRSTPDVSEMSFAEKLLQGKSTKNKA